MRSFGEYHHEARGQFHQHSTSSFYASRSQKLLILTVFFALLVSAGVKTTHRILMKLTPGCHMLFMHSFTTLGLLVYKATVFCNSFPAQLSRNRQYGWCAMPGENVSGEKSWHNGNTAQEGISNIAASGYSGNILNPSFSLYNMRVFECGN